MNESTYQWLKRIAIALTVLFIVVSIYDCNFKARSPGDLAHLEADTLFEDGAYDRALAKYEQALSEDSNHIHAMRGKARSLLKLKRYDDALKVFEEAIAREPGFGATYANRGIAFDLMGRYTDAIADYEKALSLDPELAEGPHWMTRFLRKQPDKPPGIADRAAYLRTELAKPASERVLRIPEEDQKQRSYKQ